MFSDFLLTVDFDRTLTAPNSTIPERNLEAIRYFIENGGSFTVNTGRSLAMFRRYIDQIPVNAPLLLYNGSAAYDPVKKEFTSCHLIQRDIVQTVTECMERFPQMVVEVQCAEAHYLLTPNPMWLEFNQSNGCQARYAVPGEDLGPFIKMCVYGQFHEPTVSHLFRASEAEMEQCNQVEQALRHLYGNDMEIFRSGARIIDIHARGVSKAKAARELQHQLGKKWLVCAGDGENDVSMLEEADFSYCPKDGVIAGRFENVCPCADGAVADVIYHKIPGILENNP